MEDAEGRAIAHGCTHMECCIAADRTVHESVDGAKQSTVGLVPHDAQMPGGRRPIFDCCKRSLVSFVVSVGSAPRAEDGPLVRQEFLFPYPLLGEVV